FPNTNDLLHCTDIMITDYSSIIYEFSLLERPMLFFAYDKLTYSATRGFHRDFDLAAPGKVVATTDELVKAIETEDFELWKIAAFREENFDVIDTNSSDRVIDQLILSDPHTSRAAASELDPESGDAAFGDPDSEEDNA
ncbi:CDP-glycerol glycerophosphotransferase family protein, partial [Jatrophihabitans sp.]|uniref:CDP-glycerol glycerophosphotransferase family protein n=1 Tax=Jatrophihabitans sp. TaxID=1932789 RepID=UPI0030C6936D|nr:tagB [Jatrophihabitans sp.]